MNSAIPASRSMISKRGKQGCGPGTAPGTSHPSFRNFQTQGKTNNIGSLDGRSNGMNSQMTEPKLTLDQFKIPDYLLTKEMKARLTDLRRRYKAVDDQFLSLFEKRYIIFIENGVDLKKDCNCFGDDYKSRLSSNIEQKTLSNDRASSRGLGPQTNFTGRGNSTRGNSNLGDVSVKNS